MKVLIILAIVLIGGTAAFNFPTLLFILVPVIVWIVAKDKKGGAIDNFMGIGFAIMIIGGVVAVIRGWMEQQR